MLSASTLEILRSTELSRISPQVRLVILIFAHRQNFGASSSSFQYLQQLGLKPEQVEGQGGYLDTRLAAFTSAGGR